MALKVASIETVTPANTAKKIVETLEHGWRVKCEGGCAKIFWIPNVQWKPVDYKKPDLGYVEQRFTAPGRRMCTGCKFAQDNGIKVPQDGRKTPEFTTTEWLTFGEYSIGHHTNPNNVYVGSTIYKGNEIVKAYSAKGWALRAWNKIAK